MGPLGPASAVDSGCSPTSTGTPFNIASIIVFHPNPSSLYFWLGFFYTFDITKILAIIVSQGRGKKILVAILCITIALVVIPVPSRR